MKITINRKPTAVHQDSLPAGTIGFIRETMGYLNTGNEGALVIVAGIYPKTLQEIGGQQRSWTRTNLMIEPIDGEIKVEL